MDILAFFISSQVSTPSYPRSAGLALGIFSILTGVSMLLHYMLNVCLQVRSEVTLDHLVSKSTDKWRDMVNHNTGTGGKETDLKSSLKTVIPIRVDSKNKKDQRRSGIDNEGHDYNLSGSTAAKCKKKADNFVDEPLDQQIFVPSAKMFAF